MNHLRREIRRVSMAMVYLVLSLLLLGGAAVYSLSSLHAGVNNIYRHPLAVSNAVRDIRIHLLTINQRMQDVVPPVSAAELEHTTTGFMREESEVLQLFDLVYDRFLGDKDEVIAARNGFLNWQALRRDVLAALRQHNISGFRLAKEKSNAHLALLVTQLKGLTDFAANKADSFRDTAEQDFHTAFWMISMMIALLLVSATVIAGMTMRSLRRSQRLVVHNLRQLEKAKARYLELLHAFPDGIVIIDDKQRIQMVNRNVEEMFGYSADELQHQNVEILLPPHLWQQHDKWVGRYLLDPKEHDVNQGRRVDAHRKNGEFFPVAISLSPVHFGDELLVTASIRDISNEIKMEKRVLQARKLEGIATLVGGIAHEFNNILSSMVGTLYLIRDRLKDEKSREYIQVMERSTSRATGIVKHLMAFSRQSVLRTRRVDPASLLKRALKESKVSSHIEVRIDNQLMKHCLIKADEKMLQQALNGLIDNACDAVKAINQPLITLSLKRLEGEQLRADYPELDQRHYICIEVYDNGCGISEKKMEQLFDPFFTTKEVGSGTGLGLAMIYGVIASHRGEVEVQSGEGKGTEVRVYLPCLEDAPDAADA